MNITNELRSIYKQLEALQSHSDMAHEAIAPVLEAMDGNHGAIVGCFEDEFGRPIERVAA